MSGKAHAKSAHTIIALLAAARRKEAALLDQLAQVESRLGTEAETPGDLDHAREIAHRLVSIACVYALSVHPEFSKP